MKKIHNMTARCILFKNSLLLVLPVRATCFERYPEIATQEFL